MYYFLYQITLHLLLPFTLIKIFYRSLKQPDYLKHIGERYGVNYLHKKAFFSQKKTIWFHCVSVGETNAIKNLLLELEKQHPDANFLISHTTPTGRKVNLSSSKKLFRVYLPFDSCFLIQRFLNFFNPSILIIIETEIWPALIKSCAKKNIPTLLINGRLSDKSLKGYLKIKPLIQNCLQNLSEIWVQSNEDKSNFTQLVHRKITIHPSLKYNQKAPKNTLHEAKQWIGKFNLKQKYVVTLLSSREGEEEIFLHLVKKIDNKSLVLLIVPRHPQRFNQVESLIRKTNLPYITRKNEKNHQDFRIMLGNSMGEIYQYIGISSIVFMGGSFRSFGSQNPIEPLSLLKPTFVGPSIYNFKNIILDGEKANAIIKIREDQIIKIIKEYQSKKLRQKKITQINNFMRSKNQKQKKIITLINQYL